MLSGAHGAGTRGGFGTATGTTLGPPLTEVFAAASATAIGASFLRDGFRGQHGYAAVEIGACTLAAEAGGQAWSARYTAALAWAAGEPTGTNTTDTGSTNWRGIAEAARTADLPRRPGTTEVRIADFTQPLFDADIDLDDGGSGMALEWRDLPAVSPAPPARIGSRRSVPEELGLLQDDREDRHGLVGGDRRRAKRTSARHPSARCRKPPVRRIRAGPGVGDSSDSHRAFPPFRRARAARTRARLPPRRGSRPTRRARPIRAVWRRGLRWCEVGRSSTPMALASPTNFRNRFPRCWMRTK